MMISVCVGTIRPATVQYTVDALLRQEYKDWELILVAQGSDPMLLDEVERLKKRDDRVRAINIKTFGRSRALNAAVNQAQGEICAFTDDDCEPDKDWLTTIHQCFTKEPQVGIVAGDLIAPPRPLLQVTVCPATYTIECIYRPSSLDFRGPPGFYWGGANFAVQHTLFDKVGLFDEWLGVGTDFPSAEDVDFGLRAEALDITMWTTPRSRVMHTFGRRYGTQAFLKHHRSYARGSGALGGKLELWGHRLAKGWGDPMDVYSQIKDGITNPPRYLLNKYKGYFIDQAKQEYLHKFQLGAKKLSIPK